MYNIFVYIHNIYIYVLCILYVYILCRYYIFIYIHLYTIYIGIYVFIHIYRRGREEVASGKNVAQEYSLN
jgi:hypothetical protein